MNEIVLQLYGDGEIDTGRVNVVKEYENQFQIEAGESDFEFGFTIYKNDLQTLSDEYKHPKVGDYVEVLGLDSFYGIREFIINDEIAYSRSEREQKILYEIRKREREIDVLRSELND